MGFIKRRPITTLLLVILLSSGGLIAATAMGADPIPGLDSSKLNTFFNRVRQVAYSKVKGEAHKAEGESSGHHEAQKIVVTSPKVMDVTITQPYVCQIHSRRHIEVCALESGFLAEVLVSEGQAVKKGDLMFKILPTLYQARLDAEVAEARLAELEYNNTSRLAEKNVVSKNEVMLLQAKLAKAQAKVKLAQAEVGFTNVVAPFDGIADRLHEQIGSLIAEGDVLTTLSDNGTMWVYFNVPESAYLEYMDGRDNHKQDERIELRLANGNIFSEIGKIGAIEAKFNNETGNIPFRADFPNPKGLLRHGQTGTVLISRVLKDAVVIPQRATFELLDKRYVYVVSEESPETSHAEGSSHHSLSHDEDDDDDDDEADDDDADDNDDEADDEDHEHAEHGHATAVAHEGGAAHHKGGMIVRQREIEIQQVLEDVFVLKPGVLKPGEKIVLDGVREVHDGQAIDFEFRAPDEVLAHQKFHAE